MQQVRSASIALAAAAMAVLATGCGRATVTPHRVTPPMARERERSDGARNVQAPELPASAQQASFAPDGSVTATVFSDRLDEGHSVITLTTPGGTPRVLVDRGPDVDCAASTGSVWDASRGRLVFACSHGDLDEIDTVAADGSDLRTVVSEQTAGVTLSDPSFSPDGDLIVFRAERLSPGEDIIPSDSTGAGAIVRVRADGTELIPLTGGEGVGDDDGAPQWSPDGARILFVRRTGADSADEIYTMSPDGHDQQPLTDDPFDHGRPTWSPDGRAIAYATDEGSREAVNVFVIRRQGGPSARATRAETFDDSGPSWSADSRTLVFESKAAHSSNPATIWTIPAPELPTDNEP